MKDILENPIVKEIIDIIDNMYRLGWDERNGGNVSYRLKEEEIKDYLDLTDVKRTFSLNLDASALKGQYFIATATGKYFRNTPKNPDVCLGIFRVSEDGKNAEVLWGYSDGGRSTSEIYAHLLCHIERLKTNPNQRVVIHTHPTNVVALSHVLPNDERVWTRTLWKIMSESIVVFPEGVAVLPWMLCGTLEIGEATAAKMSDRRLVIWGLHGIYGAGDTIDEAFGLIETVEKAAEVYLKYASLPTVNDIPDEGLKELADFFHVAPRKGYLDC